jgi:ATP-dependent RNA helicase DeaD
VFGSRLERPCHAPVGAQCDARTNYDASIHSTQYAIDALLSRAAHLRAGAQGPEDAHAPQTRKTDPVIQTIATALEKRGYDNLTPVQTAVTAPELQDADLLVSAQTGSGKTVAFGLAIAPTLLRDNERFDTAKAPLALVIAPTRELALQVKRELAWLFADAGAVVTSCVGGMDMRDERRALSRGADIVVATPGRLRDHIQRGSIMLDDIRAVVLDEADEMLDLGFRDDLEFILTETPKSRRTLMFSATVPRMIATLAKTYQKDAVRVTTSEEAKQHTDIEYRAMNVGARDTENALINVLRYYEAENALVFCNTRAMVNRLMTRFSNRGFSVVALSGELSQTERSHALQAMRDGRAKVCVATDVAARGIDLPKLELVIHADLPTNSETLLHRSGRTGRAGRKGISALIVPGKFRKKAERLLGGAKVRAEWVDPPSAEEVLARDEERLLAHPMWTDEVTDAEVGFVSKLTELHSAEKIAAAFLRLHNARQTAPEELAAPGAAETNRPQKGDRDKFGPSVWFSLSLGRRDNVEPRRLLPMLCRAGDISGDDIGALRIQDDHTFVEILAASALGFRTALGPDMVVEDGAVLTPVNGVPDIAKGPFRNEQRGGRDDRNERGAAKPNFKDRKPHKPRDNAGEEAQALAGRYEPKREKGDRPPRPESKSYAQKPAKDGWQPSDGAPPAPKVKKYDDGPGQADVTKNRTEKPAPKSKPKRAIAGAADTSQRIDVPSGAKRRVTAGPKPAAKAGAKPGRKPATKPKGGGLGPPRRPKT